VRRRFLISDRFERADAGLAIKFPPISGLCHRDAVAAEGV
jgi:hypothetical protein